jgi:hypothetical protein
MPASKFQVPLRALRRALLAGLLAAGVPVGAGSASADGGEVPVLAAASLKTAPARVDKACAGAVGEEAAISHAATPDLARQIEAGASADVLFPADLDWMQWLADRELVLPGAEMRLLGNSLVLNPRAGTWELQVQPVDFLHELEISRRHPRGMSCTVLRAMPAIPACLATLNAGARSIIVSCRRRFPQDALAPHALRARPLETRSPASIPRSWHGAFTSRAGACGLLWPAPSTSAALPSSCPFQVVTWFGCTSNCSAS